MPFLAPRAEESARISLSLDSGTSLLARTSALLSCAATLMAMAGLSRSRRTLMVAPTRA
jgi:hypothetical protein